VQLERGHAGQAVAACRNRWIRSATLMPRRSASASRKANCGSVSRIDRRLSTGGELHPAGTDAVPRGSRFHPRRLSSGRSHPLPRSIRRGQLAGTRWRDEIVAATIFVPTSCWCRDIQRIIQPFIRSSHRTAQHRLSRKDAIELAKHTNDDGAEGRDGHAVPSIIGMDGLSMEQVNETRLWAGRPHDKSLPGRERQNASSF
jgi:hypothetical protein